MGEEEIIAFCNRYLAINPSDISLRKSLVNEYKYKQDYKKLETELLIFLKYLPTGDPVYDRERGSVYFDLGVCYDRFKQYKKSYEYFKLAQENNISVPQEFFDDLSNKMKKNH